MSLRALRNVRLVATLLVAAVVAATVGSAGAQQAQPSFDVLRIEQEGAGLPYAVWLAWAPTIVTTEDGGAWAFFSADPLKTPEGEVAETAGNRGRLYAARFDPATGVWQPAKAMAGGAIQFGPAAVVGEDGTVHLLFTDRKDEQPGSFGTLVYTRSDGNGGWTPPRPVAPADNAGHQLSAGAVLDGEGRLHAIWQDQRAVDDAARQQTAANADVFASSLDGDDWSDAVPVSQVTVADENPSRPQLAVAGDRLVAVWSVYGGVQASQLASAIRVEWSSRPLNDTTWSTPQTLIEQNNSQMGGRLLDAAPDREGGAALIYGRRTADNNQLFLRRFEGDIWGEDIPLGSGDRGSFPQLAVTPDGTTYAVYNVGSGGVGANIQVGAVTVPRDAREPSPETILTQGEEGAQGRPVITVGKDGKVWVLYLHESPGLAKVTEVRCLRGAVMPVA